MSVILTLLWLQNGSILLTLANPGMMTRMTDLEKLQKEIEFLREVVARVYEQVNGEGSFTWDFPRSPEND